MAVRTKDAKETFAAFKTEKKWWCFRLRKQALRKYLNTHLNTCWDSVFNNIDKTAKKHLKVVEDIVE